MSWQYLLLKNAHTKHCFRTRARMDLSLLLFLLSICHYCCCFCCCPFVVIVVIFVVVHFSLLLLFVVVHLAFDTRTTDSIGRSLVSASCCSSSFSLLLHCFFHPSVLVSISVFMVLSTVFHSINSPADSPLSHSVPPVLFLPFWSFQLYISLRKSPSAQM